MIPSPKPQLADLAAKYRGVRFVHQGRNPESGLDCVGYVACVIRDYGLDLEIPADYKELPSADLVAEMAGKLLKKIPEHAAEIGDICVVAEGANRRGRHLAIIANRGTFWVADKSAGVRRRQLARETVEAYYRVPD